LISPVHDLTHNYNLHSLTLILLDFKDIFTLIEYTPNLKYLNFQSKPPDVYRILINKINIKLKEFSWTLIHTESSFISRIDHNQLINIIKQFSSSLICLSLNLVNLSIKTIEEFPFNSIKLQQFLESMIEIKQFHLYAKLNRKLIDNDDILSHFKNQYWFDHNWSFGMHEKYFYTLPFRFDYLYRL
jgi:hypothetical protein